MCTYMYMQVSHCTLENNPTLIPRSANLALFCYADLKIGKQIELISYVSFSLFVLQKIDENDVLVDQGIHYHQPQHPTGDQEDEQAGTWNFCLFFSNFL